MKRKFNITLVFSAKVWKIFETSKHWVSIFYKKFWKFSKFAENPLWLTVNQGVVCSSPSWSAKAERDLGFLLFLWAFTKVFSFALKVYSGFADCKRSVEGSLRDKSQAHPEAQKPREIQNSNFHYGNRHYFLKGATYGLFKNCCSCSISSWNSWGLKPWPAPEMTWRRVPGR